MLISLAFAQQTLDCGPLTSTCALQNDMVVAVNGMMGSPQIHQGAKARNRPTRLYAQLDALRAVAEPAGCTITGWTGGVYDGGQFDLLWDVVEQGSPETGSGTFGGGGFVGTYEGDSTRPLGGTISDYGGGLLFADRGVAGFMVGRYLRDRGSRGVFATFHGTCPGSAVEVFDATFGGRLADLLAYCDDDDCSSGAHGCSHTCVEQPGEGNVSCSCPPGMALSGGTSCVDVDECAINGSPCDDDGAHHQPDSGQDGRGCTELSLSSWSEPGYSCACDTAGGYAFDGRTCVLGDECTAGADDCHPSASCNDPNPNPGSLGDTTCACPVGTTGSGVGPSGCVDIDECAGGTDNCATVQPDGICSNTFGSFTCGCADGEQQVGDECLPTCVP